LAVYSAAWPTGAPVANRLGATLVALAIWVTTLWAFGGYARREGAQRVGAARLLAAVACALTIDTLVVGIPALEHAPYLGGLAFALLLLARGGLRGAVRQAQRQGQLCRRTLIVGTEGPALGLPAHLRKAGLTPVGYVLSPNDATRSHEVPLPIAGEIGDLGEAIRRHDISCVVAARNLGVLDCLEVVRAARRHGAEARMAERDGTTAPIGPAVDPIGMGVALAIAPRRSHTFQIGLKRLFDVATATVGLVLLSPLLAVVALAVLVTSGRPVLFRQKRVTRGGRSFTIYKFRTMVIDADRKCSESGAEVLYFKSSDRSLLTPIGPFLRRFSIDELPQLWNVLRGDMSLVGPRPLPAGQVEANLDVMAGRHDGPTGLTGWWQVNGRSAVDADHALDMDLFYVDNWSFFFDIYILFKTARAVVSRTGAY
jgi:exopolysaccharide biosynthesis polyprenyl glycosylphosphotransferase